MIKFECNSISSLINEILQNYKEIYLKKVQDKRKEVFDLEKPVYFSSALYLASRISNLKVDKKKLLTEIGIVESEFNNVINQMQEYCDELLKSKTKKKDRKKSSGKKDEKKMDENVKKLNENEKKKTEIKNKEDQKNVVIKVDDEKIIKELLKKNEIKDEEESTKKRKIEEILPKDPKKKRQVTLDYFIHQEN